jgi:hypothetical protein
MFYLNYVVSGVGGNTEIPTGSYAVQIPAGLSGYILF